MLMAGLIGAMVGALLELRFKVLILIPIFLVMSVIVAIAAIVGAEQPWRLALILVVVMIALQVGYLLGSTAAAMIRSVGSVRMRRRAGRQAATGRLPESLGSPRRGRACRGKRREPCVRGDGLCCPARPGRRGKFPPAGCHSAAAGYGCFPCAGACTGIVCTGIVCTGAAPLLIAARLSNRYPSTVLNWL